MSLQLPAPPRTFVDHFSEVAVAALCAYFVVAGLLSAWAFAAEMIGGGP